MQANAERSPSDPLKVYVHLGYGRDAENYRRRYLEGKEPDETPYGFHLAREEGFDVSFSRDEPSALDKILYRFVRRPLGFDLSHIWSNRGSIRGARAIWTMTEREAFALALLMLIGVIPRRPIISNAVWLLNRWSTLPASRRLVYKILSKYLTVMTVHSGACLPVVRHVFPKLRSELMYFGVNTGVFRISKPRAPEEKAPIHVFALGNDRTRDWDTLLNAFGNDDRFEVTLICWWLEDERIKRYRNVRFVREPAMADTLRCYEEADIVAIPMVENIFSGITVALEAAALGKPVVSSHTGGVPTYFDENEVFYVPVGDAVAMREIVLAADADLRRRRAEAAQRRFLDRDYSTRAVMGRYAAITHRVLADGEAHS